MVVSNKLRPDVRALAAVIAHSPIVVARSMAHPANWRRLPASFDAVDVAVLEWIACEARRVGRTLIQM